MWQVRECEGHYPHHRSLDGLKEGINNDKNGVQEFLIQTVKIPFRQWSGMFKHCRESFIFL